MPGFIGFIGRSPTKFESHELPIETKIDLTSDMYQHNNVLVKRFVIKKFPLDKVFYEDEDFFICTDGLILNLHELSLKYSARSAFELLKDLYIKNGPSFVNELRGTFSGCLHCKKSDTFYLFTDHLGTKPLFYYWENKAGYFIFGSELKSVAALMQLFCINTALSPIGSYCLLTFGFMLENYTLVETVRRLDPGSILTCRHTSIKIDQYYRLDNTTFHNETKESIIDNLSIIFTKAISSEYDKDKEYDYYHMGTLSGGLDSRMNILSAIKLAYKNIHTITFSQINYLDDKISKIIAEEIGFNYIFYALNDGNYLTDIEGPVFANDGLVLYSGAGHLYKALSLLNWQNFGLLHTGILGGAVLGAYLSCGQHTKPKPLDGSYSEKLALKIKDVSALSIQKYENAELFKFYNRGINGVFNGFWMSQQFTEFASPFLYKDFLEYALKIDPRLRFRHRIYTDWIFRYIPVASTFTWENTGLKLGSEYKFYLGKILKRGKRFLYGISKSNSMNPFEYWFKKNANLVESLNRYFSNSIELLNGEKELKADAIWLFNNGRPLEKTQVITLLAAIKLLRIGT